MRHMPAWDRALRLLLGVLILGLYGVVPVPWRYLTLVGLLPLGSALVVSGMAGMRLLPTTLIATVVTFLLTSEVGLIHSQRERDVVGEPRGGADPSPAT